MANSPSARKRIRRNANRAVINGARMGRIRTFIRKVEDAIAEKDSEKARAALKEAEPEIARGAKTGVLHRKTASRKLSRLSKHVKALSS